MTSSLAPAASIGTASSTIAVQREPSAQCQPEPIPASEMPCAELARHIADCRYLMRLAQARFRGSHNPADKAEAERWEALMLQAIRSRNTDDATFGGQWALGLARGAATDA